MTAGVRRLAAAVVLSLVALAARPAGAVPAFAVQTGQTCQSCHVGGFGPALTPFGRDFKLRGYTLRTAAFNVPISAMAVASYVRTKSDQAAPPAAGQGLNDNTALDQLSLFLAGGLGSHLGAFFQATYDGLAKAWSWDNLDVRAVTNAHVGKADVLLGASLNNSPTVQDAWNTLPAWGYPFTTSDLAPSPSASPLLAGALAQNTLGVTAYAWIDRKFFVEAGAYGSPSRSFLTGLGADPLSPGDIKRSAPYGRVAYETALAGGTAQVGAFGMQADIRPGRDRSVSSTDRYTDLGLDASYQKPLKNGDFVSLTGRYLHEAQRLDATCALAAGGGSPSASCAANSLTDIRASAAYYWRNKIGATVSVFDTTGSANPEIYAGSRTFKPDSSGASFQIDATPFGGRGSPLGPRFNMRVGLQYTVYGKFDGAGSNYDGAGAAASDNNTVRLFTWIAY